VLLKTTRKKNGVSYPVLTVITFCRKSFVLMRLLGSNLLTTLLFNYENIYIENINCFTTVVKV